MSQAIKTTESGSAKLTFSIEDMNLTNPFGSLMLGSFVQSVPALGKVLKLDNNGSQANVFDGEVKNGVITLDKGRTTQNITFDLVESPTATTQPSSGLSDSVAQSRNKPTTNPVKARHMPLTFAGDLNLADQHMKINATLPAEMAAKFLEVIPSVGPQAAKAVRQSLPGGIPFVITGTPRAPKFDWIGAGTKLTAGILANTGGVGGKIGQVLGDKNGKAGGDVIGDVLGGKKPDIDAIGDLVGSLTGKKKKNTETAAPAPTTSSANPATDNQEMRKPADPLGNLLDSLTGSKPKPKDPEPTPTEPARRGRRARTTAPAPVPQPPADQSPDR